MHSQVVDFQISVAAQLIQGNSLQRDWAEVVMYAEPIYIAPEIVDIIADAASTVSLDEVLDKKTVFPTDYGFAYFDTVNFALVWAPTQDLESVTFILATREGHFGSIVWNYGEPFKIPDSVDDELLIEASTWLASIVFSLWKISAERIAITGKTTTERHARKRAIRAGLDPKDITVITLRRRGSSVKSGAKIDFSHRFLVTAHWRNQWYPKLQMNKQRWIGTYIKGPDDKPLILKKRAFELIR